MGRLASAAFTAARARENAERSERLFANHVATLAVQTPEVTVLHWRQPGNWHAAMTFTLRGCSLVVTGDLYDAIYNSGIRTLESWARCDLSYFASKCVASPYGRGYREWEADRAWAYVRDSLARATEDAPGIRARWRELTRWGWPLCSQGEWVEFLGTHGQELFGEEWYEEANAGMAVSWECAAHLEGLKRAVAQLRAKGEEVVAA